MKNSWGGRGNKDQLRKNMKYKRQVHCTTSKKIVNLILYADDAMLTEKNVKLKQREMEIF